MVEIGIIPAVLIFAFIVYLAYGVISVFNTNDDDMDY